MAAEQVAEQTVAAMVADWMVAVAVAAIPELEVEIQEAKEEEEGPLESEEVVVEDSVVEHLEAA